MSKKKNHLPWIIGSAVLCVVTALIVPPLISKIASVSYKFSNMDLNEEEVFPEPIIEKKRADNTEEGEDNGRV